jgi:hypothetical protein
VYNTSPLPNHDGYYADVDASVILFIEGCSVCRCWSQHRTFLRGATMRALDWSCHHRDVRPHKHLNIEFLLSCHILVLQQRMRVAWPITHRTQRTLGSVIQKRVAWGRGRLMSEQIHLDGFMKPITQSADEGPAGTLPVVQDVVWSCRRSQRVQPVVSPSTTVRSPIRSAWTIT